MDLLTPEAQTSAHYWASVLLAHGLIGAVLTAALAWALARWTALLPWPSAVQLLTGGYGVIWEGGVQRLGAGLLDAAVDTAAVGLGGALAWAIWAHRVRLAATATAVLAAMTVVGVLRRWRGRDDA